MSTPRLMGPRSSILLVRWRGCHVLVTMCGCDQSSRSGRTMFRRLLTLSPPDSTKLTREMGLYRGDQYLELVVSATLLLRPHTLTCILILTYAITVHERTGILTDWLACAGDLINRPLTINTDQTALSLGKRGAATGVGNRRPRSDGYPTF